MVTGGQVGATGGLLQRRREVMQLEERRTTLSATVEHARQRREELQAQSQSLREEGRRLAEILREEEMKALSLHKDASGLQLFLGDLTQRIETLMGDAQRGSVEIQRLEQDARSGQAQLAQWIAEKTGQEGALQAVRGRVAQLDQGMHQLQQRLTEAQLSAQGTRNTREHRQADLGRVRQEQQETAGRIESLNQHVETLAASLAQSRAERERQETMCREIGHSMDRLKAQLVEAQERQAREMAQAQAVESSLDEVRKTLSGLQESRLTIEVKRAEVRTQLATVESTLSGTYQVDPATIEESGTPVLLSEDAPSQPSPTEEELRQQLQKIRERLERMGPINLAAINEHQELEERHRFLSTQEQDLSTSIGSLKEIIQRINRTTKDMFATTFAELQEKFGEVFAKFFRGGRAELQLVEVVPDEAGGAEGAAGARRRDRRATSGKTFEEHHDAVRRREDADGHGPAVCQLPHPSHAVLYPRRDRRSTRRREYRAVYHCALRTGPRGPVHGDHSQQADDGDCRLALWGHDGGTRHLKTRFRAAKRSAARLRSPQSWQKPP